MENQNTPKLSRSNFVVLGALVVFLVIGLGINYWPNIKNYLGLRSGAIVKVLPKPADFYYISQILPNKIPIQMPQDIIVDKNAEIVNVSVKVASNKPTIYTLQYTTKIARTQILIDYISYFYKNKFVTHLDNNGKFLYVSNEQNNIRIEYHFIDNNNLTGLTTLELTYIIYGTKK